MTKYRIRFTGRIRSAPDTAWMPFELFLVRARMFGLPVEAFHRLIDGHATMRVKALGAVTVADERGEEMDRAESVTLAKLAGTRPKGCSPTMRVTPSITLRSRQSRRR